MTIAELMAKMMAENDGTRHDVSHLLKVWGYAKTIGELEGLDSKTQFILEATAIVHDIACPFCRRKYGSAPGKLQEQESAPLVEAFFTGTGLSAEQISRISFLVCHHHTVTGIDGIDWQILLEADYLVNADEGNATEENMKNTLSNVFRTESGKRLFRSIYRI